MKRILTLLLIFSLFLSGCSTLEPLTGETGAEETASETAASHVPEAAESNAYNCYGAPIYINENEYQVIESAESDDVVGLPLNRQTLASFPVKSSDMSTMELRMLCVNFLRYAKTALWIPDEDYYYIRNKNGSKDEMLGGELYGGLPYIGNATGNVYRLMDYMDEERGVVDMSEASRIPLLFGNQCSVGSFWGWARVVNSADYDWTFHMVPSRGFLPVGEYESDDTIDSFNELYTTIICEKNGAQTMFRSYAELLPADGLITSHPSNGHVIMCSAAPVVKYFPDGTIDGDESYILITDQHQRWVEKESPAGAIYQHKNYLDRKFTFTQLLKAFYLPFTFPEFLGTDPVEETECSFSHTGDSITVDQLKAGVVTSNYYISDIYAYVKDADGKVLFYKAERASKAGRKTLNFETTVYPTTFDRYADGNHTVEVVCQLGTGERLSLYQGTLVKD